MFDDNTSIDEFVKFMKRNVETKTICEFEHDANRSRDYRGCVL